MFIHSSIITDLGNEHRSRKCTTKICAKMEESRHCHKTKRKDDMGVQRAQFIAVKEVLESKKILVLTKGFESSVF